ncbi:MAG TPA: ribosome biogenesis GTPase Der [Candidatus Binatia bacterium]|nr:ribosome biogenesis GTPase Der [Candidatus Binatia bacterium]
MLKPLPIVAIVGRANVGKSSLFNAMLERRETIVAKEAGTTRDSITAKVTFDKQQFWMVDTAGIKTPEDEFEASIQEQIEQAASEATIILVVVEADTIITEEDRRVAKLALRSKKPVYLVVNKFDRAKGLDMSGFVRLGIKPIFYTSATQHSGLNELLTSLTKSLPKARLKEADDRLHITLLGRPNVGKSSLFNTLASKQQALVHDLAGTTRDINRAVVKFKGREIELMDTAGIRRPGKIGQGIEHFSVIRSLSAIEQADICLLLMDVNEPHVALDQKIAGMVKEAGKGLILVVSKWDIAEEKTAFSRDDLAHVIAATYDFVPWAPLIFTSSVTGQNVSKIFDLALEIDERRHQRFSTSELNRWLGEATAKHPPAGLKNRTPKLNYIVQETDNPIPAFKIFGSQTKFVHWSYRRFLEHDFRLTHNYDGSPVQLWFIEKHVAHRIGHSPTKQRPEESKR